MVLTRILLWPGITRTGLLTPPLTEMVSQFFQPADLMTQPLQWLFKQMARSWLRAKLTMVPTFTLLWSATAPTVRLMERLVPAGKSLFRWARTILLGVWRCKPMERLSWVALS